MKTNKEIRQARERAANKINEALPHLQEAFDLLKEHLVEDNMLELQAAIKFTQKAILCVQVRYFAEDEHNGSCPCKNVPFEELDDEARFIISQQTEYEFKSPKWFAGRRFREYIGVVHPSDSVDFDYDRAIVDDDYRRKITGDKSPK